MANVRIGPDGSIIKDDAVVETDGRTIIRKDGTIETTSVGGHSEPASRASAFNAPPVSPLERNRSRSAPVNTQPPTNSTLSSSGGSQRRGSVDLKAVKEIEYDIQIMDGRIKNALPKNMIIATVILCILGIIGLHFLFIPAVLTGILVIAGFVKKGELETERAKLYEALQTLERGER